MKDRVRVLLYGLRLTAIVTVLIFVAVSHFGCEPEESTRPASCGSGPFKLDSKSGICRRVSDNAVVDKECCNY